MEFVFLGVPRTGSYSMESALTPLPGSNFRGKHLFDVPDWCEHYFKFCCVRNPYAREWSHYNYRRSRKQNKMYNWASKWSFDQYVYWSVNHTQPPIMYHDKTMSGMLEGIDLDFVIRYEHLQEDWSQLPELTKHREFGVPLPHLRATKNNDFKSQYNQRTADLVYEWAKEDFEQFGYDRESWKL
jgi:hypothetical protein